ncbi:MAG TPA: transcription antitermination factor NusB [Acidimicrobiales bacterium]|nr:transcription antitermination factor NusB [Acidimicrobiales bacterium]
MSARTVALEALDAVDNGAFANLVLPKLLDACDLERRDRDFATALTYGTIRMRRAVDYLIDSLVDRPLEPAVRNLLRLGAYQLKWLDVPPHAAVSEMVDMTPHRARGLVNAVLRKVSNRFADWPDLPTELSYPDWIVERLSEDLGAETATDTLRRMNEAPPVSVRPDGYFQDLASQWVAEAVGDRISPDAVVFDACAAPGGKATAVAGGAHRTVVASDLQPHRVRLIHQNARRLGAENVLPMVADAKKPPLRPGSVDAVVVDAPCSGLGALRRRPDARWRIQPADVVNLGRLQQRLIERTRPALRPEGLLAYSACTMTAAETIEVDEWAARECPDLEALPGLSPPWRPFGRGSLLLPQDADTDGMYLLLLRARGPGSV